MHDRLLVAEPLRSLSLAKLAHACDVPVTKIHELVRAFACTRPAAIRLGIGIQHCGGGAAAVRAVACLPAQTSAWRAVSGGLCTFGGAKCTEQSMNSAMRFDLSPPGTREVNMVRLAEHLLDPSFIPPIKVIAILPPRSPTSPPSAVLSNALTCSSLSTTCFSPYRRLCRRRAAGHVAT